jgi:phosphoribosyl 1,2-cyclic phosphate phosphodiesterase
MGVPRVYCSCSVCEEARITGINKRWRSSILLEMQAIAEENLLLVDCGPDWAQQMELLGIKKLEHVLITHAHMDHIIGLPQLADACRWQSIKGHVYAPLEVIALIQKSFSWLHQHLEFHAIDEGFTFGGWFIEPWKVDHGKNGYAYAYHFSNADHQWVYCPDSINLQGQQKTRLFNLDLLILGTSYDITEALQLISETKPEQVYFTHMSHGIDLLEAYDLPDHVKLAVTGWSMQI